MTSLPPEENRGEAATGSWWLHSAVGRWLLLSTVWLGVAAIFAAQQVAGRELDWRLIGSFALVDWFPWIVLSPLVLWLANRVQIDGRNWRRTVPIHIAAALLTAGVFEVSSRLLMERIMPRFLDRGTGARLWRENGRPDHGGSERPSPPRFIRARLSVPVYFLLVAAAHAVAYHRRSLERERRALTAEARLAESRLLALQTQIHPHFLFNTLNAVSSLIYTQPHAADEMICALSELLRGVLASAERREVTLAEELEFTERYLSIQQIRFADRLQVRQTIEPGLTDAVVPTLILQPLVENAVVHGIAPRGAPGVVQVRVQSNGERLVLSVSDTGRGGGPLPRGADGRLEFGENVGLRNTRARLAAIYGGDAHFELVPAEEGGVLARLNLPLRRLRR